MTTVVNDLKYSLRKREFPFCSRDALTKAEEILNGNRNISQALALKQSELAMEIIAEFVFNEIDRKGYRKKLSAVQELELALVISDHMMFDGSGTEASRNAVFLSLFPPSIPERIRVLVMLVSLSASTRSIPVLNAAGILIQQLGHNSPYSALFAKGLVQEHFLLLPLKALLDIPKIAPLFSANFLTAVTEAYRFSGKDGVEEAPEELLKVIVDWVSDNPTLCLSPLLHKLQPALPLGSIPMPATTPYLGLIKWCIFSIFGSRTPELYDTLHNSLMETLMEADKVTDRTSNVIMAQELSTFVPQLLTNNVGASSVQLLQSAIDRLAKTIEVSMMSNALYGPKQDLWRQLRMLPKNENLEIVLEKYGSSV